MIWREGKARQGKANGPANPSFKDVSFMSRWVWHGSLVVCGSHGGSEELLTGEGDGL